MGVVVRAGDREEEKMERRDLRVRVMSLGIFIVEISERIKRGSDSKEKAKLFTKTH